MRLINFLLGSETESSSESETESEDTETDTLSKAVHHDEIPAE